MKPKILIADDEPDLALLVQQLMEQDRDSADLVLNGKEAMERMGENAYDLVVSDIALGSVQGDKILEYWQKHLRDRGTRILFITGDILNHRILELLERFKVPYMTKPFDLEALRQRIRQLLLQRPSGLSSSKVKSRSKPAQ